MRCICLNQRACLAAYAPETIQALMEALETRTGNRMVRSDWVAAGKTKPDPEALQELAKLPSGFSTPGDLYIDYTL